MCTMHVQAVFSMPNHWLPSLGYTYSPIPPLDPVLDGSEDHLTVQATAKNMLHCTTLVQLQPRLILLRLVGV